METQQQTQQKQTTVARQYFKEGRALRTEVVICDTADFGVGRRVCTQKLECPSGRWRIGYRCLCDAEGSGAIPDKWMFVLAK